MPVQALVSAGNGSVTFCRSPNDGSFASTDNRKQRPDDRPLKRVSWLQEGRKRQLRVKDG
jgi:hypothetical protein